MEIKKKIIFFIITILLISFVNAWTIPILPDKFTGTVKIDNKDADIGTEIEIYINNELETTITTETKGTYTAYVKTGNTNDNIIFKILNQIAGESTRQGGENINLNLEIQLDNDHDGVIDTEDKLIGNKEDINNNFEALEIYVNDSTELTSFSGIQEIKIKDNDKIIIEFNFDFDNNILDLSNIKIEKTLNSLLIKGLEVEKTVYVDKLDNSQVICIKDSEIDSIDEISTKCNETDEYLIVCDGTELNGYTCIIENDRYKITGLQHSGVKEYLCEENWQCTDWTSCANSQQTRTCTDLNECGTTLNKLSESQDCSSNENIGGDTGGGGGGGGGGCRHAWTCNDWSECTQDGTQTRTCDYAGTCRFSNTNPNPTEQSCTYTHLEEVEREKEQEEELKGEVKQETEEEKTGFFQNFLNFFTGENKITGGVIGVKDNINYKTGITIIIVILAIIFLITIFFKRGAIIGYFKKKKEI